MPKRLTRFLLSPWCGFALILIMWCSIAVGGFILLLTILAVPVTIFSLCTNISYQRRIWWRDRLERVASAMASCRDCQAHGALWEAPGGRVLMLCTVHREGVPSPAQWRLVGGSRHP